MSGRRQRYGREAIETLKNGLKDGREFVNVFDIRDYLVDQLGAKRSHITVENARNWSRQAILELAKHDKVSVTSPSMANNYLRNPNAFAGERITSRKVRIKDTTTRIKNDLLEAQADAAQPDASEVERLKVAMLDSAKRLLEGLAS